MFGFFLSVGFVSLLYLAIGFFINKNNARYLLAGYNTMDEAKRQKFPIDDYLVFFKKFFIRMSFFSFLSAIFLFLLLDQDVAVVCWAALQIISHFFFILQSLKY